MLIPVSMQQTSTTPMAELERRNMEGTAWGRQALPFDPAAGLGETFRD